MNLPTELKTRIDEHIGLVQQHLGDLPADEKRTILQSIETRIHDALAAPSEGAPTRASLEAIIAEMDPPASYATTSPLVATSGGPAISSRGRILFFAGLGILFVLFAAIWLADPFASQWMGGEAPEAPTEEPPTESITNPIPARMESAPLDQPTRGIPPAPQGAVGK